MFNKTVLAFGGPTNQHHHTHIEMVDPSIEKGARFLDEVTREAESRVTDAVLLNIPSIDARLVKYDIDRSFVTGAEHHHVAFKINGKNFDTTIEQDRFDESNLLELLSTELARAILTQMAPTLVRAFPETILTKGEKK